MTLTGPDNQSSVLTGSGRLVATFTPQNLWRYSIGYGLGEVTLFDVVDTVDDEPLLAVHLEAGLGSIADLVSKNVALRFNSGMSVQEAVLDLRLVSHGREIARATMILPDTPCRVTAEHPVWSDLLDANTIMRLLETDRVELCRPGGSALE